MCDAWGMTTKTVRSPRDWREGRRLRAWELKQQGWTQRAIADALGITPGAVSQWMRRARDGGVGALRHCPPPGRAPKLTAEQRAALPALLARGAEAYGFVGEVWTTHRVAALIERAFRIRYHPAHVSRLLRAIGWSPQKPLRRATQRDEAAIRAWLTERWPALQAKPAMRGGPSSYAPKGQTPLLRVPLTRDHLSAISAITQDGRLLLRVQDRALRSPDVVRFLQHLLRQIPGKLLVIWDGAPIHRGQPVKDFLAAGGAERLHLEPLPAYAPELNPDEGIWRYLKRVELRNVCCPTLWDLSHELRLAVARLRHKAAAIRGCIAHAGYAV
jgi:transposase